MTKPLRRAVRCFLIKNNKIVTIKYIKGRAGYYDIPGGKIEALEHPQATVKREFKEVSGLLVEDLEYRGKAILEYDDRIYDIALFIANKYSGDLQSDDESTVSWMDIQKLANEEQKFAWMVILRLEFLNNLFDHNKLLDVHIKADDNDHILDMSYHLKEYSYHEVKKYLPNDKGLIRSSCVDESESL